jgi:hypothetical protein
MTIKNQPRKTTTKKKMSQDTFGVSLGWIL